MAPQGGTLSNKQPSVSRYVYIGEQRVGPHPIAHDTWYYLHGFSLGASLENGSLCGSALPGVLGEANYMYNNYIISLLPVISRRLLPHQIIKKALCHCI